MSRSLRPAARGVFAALALTLAATPAHASWTREVKIALNQLMRDAKAMVGLCDVESRGECPGGTAFETISSYYDQGTQPKPEDFPATLTGRWVAASEPEILRGVDAFFHQRASGGPLMPNRVFARFHRERMGSALTSDRHLDHMTRDHARKVAIGLKYDVRDGGKLTPLRFKRGRAFLMAEEEGVVYEFRKYETYLVARIRSIAQLRRTPDAPVVGMLYLFAEPDLI